LVFERLRLGEPTGEDEFQDQALGCAIGNLKPIDMNTIAAAALTVEIQRSIEQADFENRQLKNIEADDRRFVRKMLNELSVSPEAKPTPAQGQWLLSIKRWLEEK
jgi:hypothetical protein